MYTRSLLAALLVAAPSLAQNLTFVEGNSLTSLDVHVVAEGKVGIDSTLLLQGIEVLPIEMAGRTASMELRTDIVRRDLRHGLYRLELPGGCRLLEYRRDAGRVFGYLLVPRTGEARVLLERPGTGVNNTGRPFADRVSIDSAGRTMCVLATGGGMHVIRLDGTSFPSTGSPVRFVAMPNIAVPMSLMVGATHAYYTTLNNDIYSLPLADLGTPVACTPTIPGTSFRMKDEIAMSGDGTTAVFLYGTRNETLRLFKLQGTGPAVQLPPPPSKYEEPGYLPEGEGHLRLMLNHDATRLFYVDGVIRDESHLLDLTGVLGDLQITQDAIFQPYIGIHILPTFKGNTLIASIGDPDRMDWFAADLAPTGNVVRNLTGTGSFAQPFPSGTLIPSKLSVVGDVAMITDVSAADANRQTLRAIDLLTNTSNVVHHDLPGTIVAGSSTSGTADLVVPGPGDRLYSGATGALIAQSPTGVRISPPLSASWYRAVEAQLSPVWSVLVLYLPDGTMVFGPALLNVRQMVVTHQDSLVISTDDGALLMAENQPTSALPIGPAPAVRVFLSGAGG
ncbi:MAG: hypothetical protein ABL997_13690 [Planctomycetota bacterium]